MRKAGKERGAEENGEVRTYAPLRGTTPATQSPCVIPVADSLGDGQEEGGDRMDHNPGERGFLLG